MQNIVYHEIFQLSVQLLNNEVSKTIFCERESRLGKLEEEIDCAHTKMQDVLETFLSTKQEEKVILYDFHILLDYKNVRFFIYVFLKLIVRSTK